METNEQSGAKQHYLDILGLSEGFTPHAIEAAYKKKLAELTMAKIAGQQGGTLISETETDELKVARDFLLEQAETIDTGELDPNFISRFRVNLDK